MALSKKPYKGCRDFFPKDMRNRKYLFEILQKTCESFAYEAYDGPLLEEVKLYLAKSGEELIGEQIYDFIDKGKRHVAIRPEMTPTVARMAAQIHREMPKPFRWYSIANFMRYEKPQRGRLREFTQLNVDIFGAPDELAAYEIIDLTCSILKNYGADDSMFSIQVNDRRIVDTFFSKILKVNHEQALKLYKVIDKSKKVTAEALDTMIKEIMTDIDQFILFKEYIQLNSFEELFHFLTTHKINNSGDEFKAFYEMISENELIKFVNYDPTIVRGLDYYTGIVFEIFDKHPDNRRAIAGGGAYANLLQIFNEPPLPGIGFGLGDVTLIDFLESHNLLPSQEQAHHDLMIAYLDADSEIIAFKLADNLRKNNLKVDLHLGEIKFSKVFKTAEQRGHHFLIMIGENERKNEEIQIKNLINRDGKNIQTKNIQEIIEFIKG